MKRDESPRGTNTICFVPGSIMRVMSEPGDTFSIFLYKLMTLPFMSTSDVYDTHEK